MIRQLIVKFQSHVVKTLQSERLFSLAGYVVTKQRLCIFSEAVIILFKFI